MVGSKLEHSYPVQVKKFFETDCEYDALSKPFDLLGTPWCNLPCIWQRCDEVIDAVTRVQKKLYSDSFSTGVNTFYDAQTSKIQTFELFGINDQSKYRQANIHPTCELFETIGCSVKDEFAQYTSLITDIINAVPYEKVFRIHVNMLLPGGYLPPHKDTQQGDWTKGLLQKILIPLNLPTGFRFKFWNAGDIPLAEGNMYAVNTGNFLHAVINDSSTVRYMLHIKGVPSSVESYQKYLANQHR